MDQSIKQFGQDLALANYAKETQSRYLRTAGRLSERFGRPVAELSARSCARTSRRSRREAKAPRG
jgi:hypothetical protein